VAPGPAAGSEPGLSATHLGQADPDTGTTEVLDAFVEPGDAAEPAMSTAPDTGSAAARPAPQLGAYRRGRLAFRHWRRTRAFWGGFLLVLSGSEILYTYNAPFKVVIHFGLYGIAGFALPVLVLLLGLLVWFDPEHRVFYSIIALLAAAGTWLTSNLGGFFIGMLLGLAGATLTYGWSNAPVAPKKAMADKANRAEKAEKRPAAANNAAADP
jgi:hypothetical protein